MEDFEPGNIYPIQLGKESKDLDHIVTLAAAYILRREYDDRNIPFLAAQMLKELKLEIKK